jgi:molecular chaperone GrpE (heat shock protein)
MDAFNSRICTDNFYSYQAPRRSGRANITAQINSLKTQGGRTGGVDTKLQEFEAQLKKAQDDDAPLENELELLKRTAIRESESIKWKALKEVRSDHSLL